MAKIIGNTTATPNPQPDWNQTDSSKADYIKNKPDISKMEGIATTDYVDEQVATKTQVTVDGNPVQTFDADTKVSKMTTGSGIKRAYIMYGDEQTAQTIAANPNFMDSGNLVQYFNASAYKDTQPPGERGHLICNTPKGNYHAANKKYVDDTVSAMSDSKVSNLNTTDSVLRIYTRYGEVNGSAIGANHSAYIRDSGTRIACYGIGDRTSNPTILGHLMTGNPEYSYDAANKKYVDENFVPRSGDSTIDGTLSVTGDLHITGTTYAEDTETLRVADNIIELNSDKTDFSTTLSGLAINKNADSTYGIMYDPTNDTVKLGEGKTENGVFAFNQGEGAPLTVRDDSSNIADGAIMIFDKSKNRIVDSGYTIDSFKQWVREYIESYMSTEIVISTNSYGGQTLDIVADENSISENGNTLIIGG